MAPSFLFQAHPAHVQYFFERLKSPLAIFDFFKKLPIIQKIIPEYLVPC